MTDWQEHHEQEQNRKWKHSETTTERVVRWFTLAMQEIGIVERMNAAADEAHKAWTIAQRIDRRIKQRNQADIAALANQVATLKAKTADGED